MNGQPQVSLAMQMPASEYRRVQHVMPGVDALYHCIRAICDAKLEQGSEILIVGAGGGREIEALVASPHHYRLTGIDPSDAMLASCERKSLQTPTLLALFKVYSLQTNEIERVATSLNSLTD